MAGLHDDPVASFQRCGNRFLNFAAVEQAIGRRFPARLAQGIGLRLAARLGQRGREVGEEHGQQEPDVQGDEVGDAHLAAKPHEPREREQQAQHCPDFDHKHHRVLPLDVRPEHKEGLLQGRAQQMRRKQPVTPAGPAGKLQFLGRRTLGIRGDVNCRVGHGKPQ